MNVSNHQARPEFQPVLRGTRHCMRPRERVASQSAVQIFSFSGVYALTGLPPAAPDRVIYAPISPNPTSSKGSTVPNQLSRRVQRVKPSPTLAVTARAAKLKAEGKDVIGLGAGEPDFDTPAHVAKAGIDAIQSGFTRYTNVDGVNELKDAIIAKFEKDNAIKYDRSQILVSSGAK